MEVGISIYNTQNDYYQLFSRSNIEFKHTLLPNMIQQCGWVTRSHNISYDPSSVKHILCVRKKRLERRFFYAHKTYETLLLRTLNIISMFLLDSI